MLPFEFTCVAFDKCWNIEISFSSPRGFGRTGHFCVTGIGEYFFSRRSRRGCWALSGFPIYQVGNISAQDQPPSFHCEFIAPWYSCFCWRRSKVGGQRGLEVWDKTRDFENCSLVLSRIRVSSRAGGLAWCGGFHRLQPWHRGLLFYGNVQDVLNRLQQIWPGLCWKWMIDYTSKWFMPVEKSGFLDAYHQMLLGL